MLQEDDGFSNRLLSIKREEVHACKKDDSERGNKGKKRNISPNLCMLKSLAFSIHKDRQKGVKDR